MILIKHFRYLALSGALLLLAPAAAVAQTPSQDAYGGTLGEQLGGGGGQVVNASGGGLPFTGLDLAVIVLIGLTLVAVGAALRHASRTPRLPL